MEGGLFLMIYVHYCEECDFLHLLSGHRTNCPGCGRPIAELKISYQEYFAMNAEQRDDFLEKCGNPNELEKMTFCYKKHKFSKWYKEGGVRG